MKYGLSETDAIDDNGKILRGGAPKNQWDKLWI
jgi:hypothetical protein